MQSQDLSPTAPVDEGAQPGEDSFDLLLADTGDTPTPEPTQARLTANSGLWQNLSAHEMDDFDAGLCDSAEDATSPLLHRRQPMLPAPVRGLSTAPATIIIVADPPQVGESTGRGDEASSRFAMNNSTNRLHPNSTYVVEPVGATTPSPPVQHLHLINASSVGRDTREALSTALADSHHSFHEAEAHLAVAITALVSNVMMQQGDDRVPSLALLFFVGTEAAAIRRAIVFHDDFINTAQGDTGHSIVATCFADIRASGTDPIAISTRASGNMQSLALAARVDIPTTVGVAEVCSAFQGVLAADESAAECRARLAATIDTPGVE